MYELLSTQEQFKLNQEIFRKEQELSRLDIAKTGEFWKKTTDKIKKLQEEAEKRRQKRFCLGCKIIQSD